MKSIMQEASEKIDCMWVKNDATVGNQIARRSIASVLMQEFHVVLYAIAQDVKIHNPNLSID